MATVQLLNREERNHAEFRAINAGHRDANLQANFYHAIFFPVLELVSALAVSLIVWYGGRQVMWTGHHAGHAGGLHPVHAALLPPHLGPEREVQHPAAGHGLRASASSTCSTRRPTRPRRCPRPPRRRGPARDAPPPAAPAFRGRIEFDGRHVRLRRRDPRARGRLLHGRARREGRAGGRHRLGQDHAREPAAGLLPAAARRHPRGRPPARRVGHARAAPPRRARAAGPLPVLGQHRREPRARGRRRCPARRSSGAAREVHADRFIERLPGGYDAEVHERGATFSAGERQLLAFARALAARPARAGARRGHLLGGHPDRGPHPGRRCAGSCAGAPRW